MSSDTLNDIRYVHVLVTLSILIVSFSNIFIVTCVEIICVFDITVNVLFFVF